jgi:hypothetical protein
MKCNAWTLALIGAGVASLPFAVNAEEKPSTVLTAISPTTLSGYVDTSMQWNIGTGNAVVPSYAFGGTSKADGFNLNVVKLSIEKPADAGANWSAGYKVDLLFGPDANAFATQSSGTAADFGIKQAYVDLHAPIGNGLDMKIGTWDTLIGYEVFDSVNNPNFTRSYGYTMEPTTHTGVQFGYQFCEAFSMNAGIANDFGPMINARANPPKAESFKTYMASMTFTAPSNCGVLAGSTLTGCIINGYNPAADHGDGENQTSYYIGATVNTPVKGLKVGACYDYAGVSVHPFTSSSYENAVGGYFSFQATEKLSLYGRGEYATSDTGIFLARKVVEFTGTIQYDLWKNVLSRLEVRWDHAADSSDPYGGKPGDETVGGKDNSVIVMANFVYKF